MRILGVDPGSRITGWGIVIGSPSAPQLLECDVIRLDTAAPLAVRLHQLHAEFETLVLRLAPQSAAVETPFHGANARSALQLAHARGVILAVLAGAGIEVAEYPPATIKKAVTGNGRAGKRQVRAVVGRWLGGGEPIASLDRADALAVAYCHATAGRYQAALERAVGRQRRRS